jgi:hypothetical protein
MEVSLEGVRVERDGRVLLDVPSFLLRAVEPLPFLDRMDREDNAASRYRRP